MILFRLDVFGHSKTPKFPPSNELPIPTSIFTDSDGQKGQWAGIIPTKGAVFCEFVAPEFGEMGSAEGLFNIRLSGGSIGGYHGISAILKQSTGCVGFGSRPISGSVNYADGPSFHPGKQHYLFLSYDLTTGDVSMMLDGGSVFALEAPSNWTNATADSILLWDQRFMGASAGLSGGCIKISLYDAGELPS